MKNTIDDIAGSLNFSNMAGLTLFTLVRDMGFSGFWKYTILTLVFGLWFVSLYYLCKLIKHRHEKKTCWQNWEYYISVIFSILILCWVCLEMHHLV